MSRSYGQISMKVNGSIATGAWTNWLGFELDPDHSPDPGTGFSPDFLILAGYLNKLWTDVDEILWVDSCGVCTIWLRFEPDPDQSPDPGSGHVFKIGSNGSKSNGRVSMKFYEWKAVFNFGSDSGCGIRIRILPRLLTTVDFDEIWCRDGAYDVEELSKL